jgi:hypothetical protein
MEAECLEQAFVRLHVLSGIAEDKVPAIAEGRTYNFDLFHDCNASKPCVEIDDGRRFGRLLFHGGPCHRFAPTGSDPEAEAKPYLARARARFLINATYKRARLMTASN